MNKSISKLSIRDNVSLAPYTSLGLGGPARFFAAIKREDHISEAMDFAHAHGCPVFILGSGSNLVVADAGFAGLVAKIEIAGIQSVEDETIVASGAGEKWDDIVQHCVAQNLAGIECLSGIPGTIGAAPVQNIGAYGEEIRNVALSIRVFDRETFDIFELSASECGFGYRSSIFNTTHIDRYIILRVSLGLRQDGAPRLQYRDLQLHFSGNPKPPSLRQVREAVLRIRESKGMILLPDDPDSRSAGSFFKNPILSKTAAGLLAEKARTAGLLSDSEAIPTFPAGPDKEKIAAAWLIEHAGFRKGYSQGSVGISTKHALALINRGGASSQDIIDLMRAIQEHVFELFHVELKPEPVFLGFDKVPSSQFPVPSY
jgi:UDP-N-acetylmuramate dehydrogenase